MRTPIADDATAFAIRESAKITIFGSRAVEAGKE